MRIMQNRQWLALILAAGLLVGCGQSASIALVETPTVPVVPTEATANESPATAPAAGEEPAAPAEGWQVTDYGAVQFSPNATQWNTTGGLKPGAATRYSFSAMQGQQMTVWLNTGNSPQQETLVDLYVAGADGEEISEGQGVYWSMVLPATQTYYVEVRSLSSELVFYTLTVEISTEVIDPTLGDQYEPISLEACRAIQEASTAVLPITPTLSERAPFRDSMAGEAGQGCKLVAVMDGTRAADSQSVVDALVASAGQGWTVQSDYQANGPTGATVALTRDMGLMFISVTWSPVAGVTCPADQPIASCNLTPEQKQYLVQIDVAQYRAPFSLDGHWEDASTGFSLDLSQDWKNVYGHHTIVVRALGTEKIDSLDDSITGSIKGQLVDVQFQSSFAVTPGTAQITYVDVNTILWQIVTPPDGEFYIPIEATLTRK